MPKCHQPEPTDKPPTEPKKFPANQVTAGQNPDPSSAHVDSNSHESDRIAPLPRPRLIRRISLALEQGPVCLLAPPGYGKTVLLREYVAQQPDATFIALRADNVERIQLDTHLARLPRHAPIALDDIQHLAANDAMLATVLAALIEQDRPWLLAGRTLPGPLMQVADTFTLLGMEALTLTAAESDYLLQTAPLPLDATRRRHWYTRTGGWPLALSLAQQQQTRAASVPDDSVPDDSVPDVSVPDSVFDDSVPANPSTNTEFTSVGSPNRESASTQRIEPRDHAYAPGADPLTLIAPLARRLLDELPPPLQHFMLVSALPQRFNHVLCSELLQSSRHETATRQAELIRRNLFLQAEEQPGWYRYHDLIRDFLQQEARLRLGEAQIAQLLVKAARWFHDQDELYAAIDHALLAADTPLAAAYLHELEPTVIWDQGLFRTYRRWVSALDKETQARNPWLLIRLGRALLDVGERVAARGWFDLARQYAAAAQDQEALWGAQTALAKLYNMEGELSTALALCQNVMEQASPTHPAYLQALNASGNALVQLNRFRAAHDHFEHALQVLTSSPPDDLDADPMPNRAQMVTNLHHNLAVGIHIPLGRFEAAQEHLRINDAYYATRPVARSLHLLAWCGFHEGYGDWAALAQDLAEIEAAEAQSEYPDEDNIWYFWHKALYHTGMGEYVRAQALLDELRPMMVTDEDLLCHTYAQAWLLRRMGRWDVSRETIRAALDLPYDAPFYRGMLALEHLLVDAQEQIADETARTPADEAISKHPPAEGKGAHAVGKVSVDPLLQAGAALTHNLNDELRGFLQTRATPWLLRVRAHLACTCYALTTPGAHQRARRHIASVLHKTEQKFFFRLLIAREPELGLRFWVLCLEAADVQEIARTPKEADKMITRANQAIQALMDTQNGLTPQAVLAPLHRLVEHEFSAVRGRAVRLLAQLGHETSIPMLAQRVPVETDRAVQAALAQALETLESNPPPRLTINLLGEFKVTRGERPLEMDDWHRPAVRRLFQYFVLHPGQPLSRERILDDLWPDSPPQAARNTFRTLFSWLRRTLEPYLRPKTQARYFAIERDIYCFAPDAVGPLIESDVAVFETTVRHTLAQSPRDDLPHLPAEFLRTLENWSPLLPELPYEPWAVLARERVAGLYVEGCLHAAQALLHLRREPEAARWARQVIEIAPWLEEAYQALMRAHARQGQRSLALHVYGEAVDALQHELDVAPSALTEWLAQRLRQGEEI